MNNVLGSQSTYDESSCEVNRLDAILEWWCAVEDAMALMKKGANNRCVGETKMNRASSRSHSVFSMKVECRTTMENGISKLRYGTLHIVDLAGSERVKISGATGAALTEAAEINVSLTTLGRVISKVREATNERFQ
jgi:Kinesin motor domain